MPLDRIITIEYPSISRDTFGSELRTLGDIGPGMGRQNTGHR